jgi:putative colanic acid biosynthesis UDP-glucose lipid carrier transferase
MIAAAWLAAWTLTTCFSLMTHLSDSFDHVSGPAWFILAGLLLMQIRMLLRVIIEFTYRRGIGVRRTAIAGTNELALHVARQSEQYAQSGFKLVGFYDDRNRERLNSLDENLPPFAGSLDELIQSARRGEIDTVLITLPMRAEARIAKLLDELADTTASAYIVPDFFVFELLHSRWTEFGGLPAVSVFESPIYGVDGWIKRNFDIIVSVLAIAMLSPILIMCAIAVKLSSAGPIIFRQKRYGLDGKEILVWKFRSMRVCDNGPVVKQATKNDPRVTAVGAFLRKSSLDELPQLFNVLMGTMSLVGPRPHASAHNEQYRKLIRGYMMRHKVRPGITGLAQVHGSRGETDTIDKMETRIQLDHRYIREWSLWMDIRILFRTVGVVFRGDAY